MNSDVVVVTYDRTCDYFTMFILSADKRNSIKFDSFDRDEFEKLKNICTIETLSTKCLIVASTQLNVIESIERSFW